MGKGVKKLEAFLLDLVVAELAPEGFLENGGANRRSVAAAQAAAPTPFRPSPAMIKSSH